MTAVEAGQQIIDAGVLPAWQVIEARERAERIRDGMVRLASDVEALVAEIREAFEFADWAKLDYADFPSYCRARLVETHQWAHTACIAGRPALQCRRGHPSRHS